MGSDSAHHHWGGYGCAPGLVFDRALGGLSGPGAFRRVAAGVHWPGRAGHLPDFGRARNRASSAGHEDFSMVTLHTPDLDIVGAGHDHASYLYCVVATEE